MSRFSSLSAVVVGAGQSGLGVSHFLTRAGVDHRVLERGRVGESWRSQRWDSFRMNTPNILTVMPGGLRPGLDPKGFMTHRDFAELLDAFVPSQGLHVETETPVLKLTPDGATGHLPVEDAAGDHLRSKRRPRIGQSEPAAHSGSRATAPQDLHQLHTAHYRRPAQLPPGAVLVVGTASSGVQVADDLLNAGRNVYIATSTAARIPRRHRGRDFGLWLLRAASSPAFLSARETRRPDQCRCNSRRTLRSAWRPYQIGVRSFWGI